MLAINRKYDKIEVTTNFLFGNNLAPGHELAGIIAAVGKD
jgi:hypothetical protein